MTIQAKRRCIAMPILSVMTASVPPKGQAASLEYRGNTVYISGHLTPDDAYNMLWLARRTPHDRRERA
jgi:hypothetical protein